MKEQIPEKITFQGVIHSMQSRSNVWRYRLDNRTHSLTGYNLFLTGVSNGVEGDFLVAISEKQQDKSISQIDIISGELLLFKKFECMGTTCGIYSINDELGER